MTPIYTRPTIIYPSLAMLVLTILFPQLYILQALFYTPIYISSTLFFLIAYLLYRAIKSDRRPSSPSTSSAVRTKHALRQLKFTTPAAWSAVLTRQSWEDKPSSFNPIHRNATAEVNSRLDSFLGLIKLHFILPWYHRISPSPAFPHAVESLIRHILSDLTGRAEDVDWPDMMVLKVLPIVSDHFQHYRSIEHLSSSSSAPSPNPALPLPLPRRAHPALSSHLHTSSGTSPSIEAHLRDTLARVLDRSLPEKDKSEVVLTIVREIILGAVLLPVFDMLCDPDFWNRQIDEKGGTYLHEQKQVDKFLSALSALPAPTASANNTPLPSSKSRKSYKNPATPSSTSISSESSSKQFDNFLRSIGKLKTLGDARRLRSDVERELRSAKLALADELRQGQSSKEGDKKLKRAEKYVQRLERAKVDIDRKVEILSGQPGKPRQSLDRSPMSSMILEAASTEIVTLYSILSDPSSLAYWLEHMERRGRSRLVQYWLTVEGFKDPLEAAGLNSALDSTSHPSLQLASSSNHETVGEDVAFLYEMYFAAGQTGITIPSKHRQVIEETAQSSSTSLSPSDAQKVKHAVFASQKDIYEQMADEDWPAFKKRELYIKALSDLKRAGVSLAPLTVAAEPPQVASPILGSTPLPRTPIIRPPATPNESSRSLFDILSPSARPRQIDKRGSFSPARPPTPTASVSITPLFQRSMTSDTQIPLFKDVRRVSPGNTESKFSSLESSVPTTPPPPVRRSSHLDFLISGGESKEDIPDNRDKLFGDDDDIDEDDEAYVEAQRIEAIQAALNEIIASDDMASSRVIDLAGDDNFTSQPKSPSASMILFDKTPKVEDKISKLTSRSAENLKTTKNGKVASSAPQSRLPSVALPDVKPIPRRRSIPRLSLSPEKSSKHLFDDELIDEDEVLIDEEELDNNANDVIQLAAPGDLQLSVEIARLQDKIQELVQQDHLLDTLIRQAELTGNQVELRILRRSQSSVRREQRTAIFQKAQFEQQEEENRLIPGRTKVTIPSSVVTSEDGENGKQVVRYTIEVSQVDEDGKIRLGWVVARRYNEFYELDKALKDWAVERHDLVEELKSRLVEMPGKRLVPNLSASFVESRRAGLERYLQSLLTSSIICNSPLLRAFLSRSPVPLKPGAPSDPMSSSTASLASLAPHNIVKSLYKTMATSLDDALLGPSMLDMMYTTLSRQLVDLGGLVGLGGEDLVGLLPSALKGGPYTPHWLKNDPIAVVGAGQGEGRIGPIGGESGMTSFTGPICDLFIEVFDLKENNWLRRQAIVVILQQFLGSTIERKVRDSFRSATSSESLEKLISNLQENLFPDGERRPPSAERTEQEKLDTRLRAGKKLGMLIPDVAANMIGRSNARRAARRVFGALQDTRLNQHLILSIMDEILNAMFPPR